MTTSLPQQTALQRNVEAMIDIHRLFTGESYEQAQLWVERELEGYYKRFGREQA